MPKKVTQTGTRRGFPPPSITDHPLLRVLIAEATRRGDTLATMARHLDVSYERVAQWRRKEADVANAGRAFIEAAGQYLGIPTAYVLCLAGVVRLEDFVAPGPSSMRESAYGATWCGSGTTRTLQGSSLRHCYQPTHRSSASSPGCIASSAEELCEAIRRLNGCGRFSSRRWATRKRSPNSRCSRASRDSGQGQWTPLESAATTHSRSPRGERSLCERRPSQCVPPSSSRARRPSLTSSHHLAASSIVRKALRAHPWSGAGTSSDFAALFGQGRRPWKRATRPRFDPGAGCWSSGGSVGGAGGP